MANRFFTPDEQFADSTGAALSGAQLFFYATGTSTKQNTYSDSALSIANSNPVVLDSSGRAGSIFLQNLKYKVVLAPANDTDPPTSPIWTMDPVYASDVSTIAQVQGTNGNPNGQLAGTAGSAGIPASMDWDYTNDILYVCTTTGNAASAVWTAVNAAAATQLAPAPGGRLTLVSATPVMNSDQVAATAVIYTPYINNAVPIYNGTTTLPVTFSELTLTLVASHAADTLYDIFIFSNSGVPTLATGPAWNNSTAGSCARGTGASTTQLTMLNGHLVNAVQITGRNGSSTFTISANQATYLGTMFTDHTAGQVTCHVNSFGQNRKYGVWNAFNRVPIILQAGDSTASWIYTTASFRASNNTPSSFSSTSYNVGSGTACNGINIVHGLAEEYVDSVFSQACDASTTSRQVLLGIGYNSVTAASGLQGSSFINGTNQIGAGPAFIAAPALGLNILTSLEKGDGTAAGTFVGTSASMLLKAAYRG